MLFFIQSNHAALFWFINASIYQFCMQQLFFLYKIFLLNFLYTNQASSLGTSFKIGSAIFIH